MGGWVLSEWATRIGREITDLSPGVMQGPDTNPKTILFPLFLQIDILSAFIFAHFAFILFFQYQYFYLSSLFFFLVHSPFFSFRFSYSPPPPIMSADIPARGEGRIFSKGETWRPFMEETIPGFVKKSS
jgi:hypothetical protein